MVAKNRLGELKSQVSADEDVEVPIMAEQSPELQEFLERVTEIRVSTNLIEQKVKDIRHLQSDILSDPNRDNRKQDELNELQADVKKNINKAIAKLREMDNAIQKELDATPRRSSQDQQGEYVAASIRMKQGQHAALHRRLKTIMEDYNQAITNFEEKQKEDQKRRIKISVGNEVPEEEIDRIVEDGKDLGQIFTGIQANARDLADIEARHNDIMKLEQSIRELHDMFVDMATLVESQGALVDRIEANVENTKDYVGTAVKETKQAMQYQKSAAKKKLAMLVCLSVVIGLLVLLVLSYVPMPF